MKILGMGVPELLIILAVILLIFGPKNLPKLGASVGKTVKSLREGLGGGEKLVEADDEEEAVEEIVEEAAPAAAPRRPSRWPRRPTRSHKPTYPSLTEARTLPPSRPATARGIRAVGGCAFLRRRAAGAKRHGISVMMEL